MPELPEVETVRRELDAWLPGRTIVAARREDAPKGPKYRDLERATGQRIEALTRRGKFILLSLSGGDELVIHLGMTGQIHRARPVAHVRACLELDRGVLFFRDVRRFGRFLVVPAGAYGVLPTLAHLGPEPLDPQDFTLDRFAARLRGRKTSIKAAIMSQRPVAGVGNIYTDESLWQAQIHPRAEAGRIGRRRLDRLRGAIVEILGRSVAAGGTTLRDYRTVAGDTGAFVHQLQAYGREGAPCMRCDRVIRRVVVAQRGTWFCPGCQRK
ncbi:MAG: bifunctional DNA-formamidopyrimidine glycosylase/DNA-(apurinic or apyrimidinic site) lyase [Myxococcota bacterium]